LTVAGIPNQNLWSYDDQGLTKKKSVDIAEVGTYYMRYKFFLESYTSIVSDYTTDYFTYTITNPCADPSTVAFTMPQPLEFDYTVGDAPLSIEFPAADFAVVPSFCGDITN